MRRGRHRAAVRGRLGRGSAPDRSRAPPEPRRSWRVVAVLAEALQLFLPQRQQLLELCRTVEARVVLAFLDAVDHLEAELLGPKRQPILQQGLVAVRAQVEL